MAIPRVIPACVLIVVVVAFAAFAARASDADLSTPQAAVASLQRAVAEQDAAAAVKTLYCADDADRALAAAFSELLVAAKKLDDATRAKFGTSGPAVGSQAAAGDALAALAKAQVAVKGDEATLTTPSTPSRTVRLKRNAAGQWQIVVRDFANPADPDLAAQAEVLKTVAGVFNDAAAKITEGKFSGPQDAQAAIQSKLAGALIKASRAAAIKAERAGTRPATTGAATRP